jgi:uncharacterized lipoprotein
MTAVAKGRIMMPKKIVLSVLVVLLAAGLSACSVMQSTYQQKVDEADSLTRRDTTTSRPRTPRSRPATTDSSPSCRGRKTR